MFLKRIFKKPEPQTPAVERLTLDALLERMEGLRAQKLETAKPKFDSIVGGMIRERAALLNLLKELADARPSEEVHPGLLKTSTEAKKLFVEKTTRALTDIEHPPRFSTDILVAFDEKLAKTTNLTTDAMTIHGRYVGATFGPEFAAVQLNIRRIQEIIRQIHATIGEILRENKALDLIASEINSLAKLIQEAGKMQEDIKTLERQFSEAEKRINEEKDRLKRLTSSEEFKHATESKHEIDHVELEIARVESDVASAFSDISRPLRKLEKLISSGKHQMDREKVKTLELCINDPLEIVTSDEKISITVGLLQETAELLEGGKIDLNERERRKKLERTRKLALRLTEFKNRLEALRGLLETQWRESEHPVRTHVSDLEQSINQHESELKRVKISIEGISKMHKLTMDEIEEKRVKIEKLAGEISGTKVELTS